MKRAILVGTGTVAGLAAVLGLNPSGEPATSASTAVVTPSSGGSSAPPSDLGGPAGPGSADGPGGLSGGSDPGSGTDPGSDSGSGSGSSSGGGDAGTSAAGQVDGDVIATRWGNVQVRAVVTDGALSDVVALQLPDGDRRSYEISTSVEPLLREQALAAQSAAIDGVSGATYTSDGYARSLASALSRAGL